MLTPKLIDRLTAVGEFYQTAAAIATVPGWLHELEGYALMCLTAFDPGEGAVAEIGSFKGRSTCWLAAGLQQRAQLRGLSNPGTIHAIDHFTGSPEHQPGGTHPDPDIAAHGSTLPAFRANIVRLGLTKLVTAIQSPSVPAAKQWSGGPIRLLFIDGDHSYDASKADLEAWRPHLAPSALVGFHDVGVWEGVSNFYEELTSREKGLIQEVAINSLRVVRLPVH
jgi:predicted O-methyltransferase YrrM